MSTRYTEITRSLRGRWKPSWSGSGSFSQLRIAFDESLNAVGKLCDEAASVTSLGKYSPDGLNDEIRRLAKGDAIPVLRRAARAVEKAQSATRAKRDTLALPAIDPADAAGGALRTEMRAWLRSLPRAEALATLLHDNVDQRLLQAALEVPPAMAGLTDDTRGHVVQRILEQQHGPELAHVNELDEAAELTNAAIGVALFQLQRETGFSESNAAGFDAWMEAASADVDREIALEEGSLESEIVAETQSEQRDFRKEIEAIVDEAFARALPGMFPEHPVNGNSLG